MGAEIIRKATLADLPAILAVFRQSILTVCVNDYSTEQLQAWAGSTDNPDKWIKKIKFEYFLVVEKDEKTIGFASLERGGYLDLLYVHPDYLHQGVGRNLLSRIEQEAKNQGYASLHTFGSITALPFFEKNGYFLMHANTAVVNGIELKNFKMVKQLF